jgi:hypothetical protein
MDYKGIRYTIRTRIVRQQWTVSIHPAGVEIEKIVIGARLKAEQQAQSMIDTWIKKKRAQDALGPVTAS